MVLALVIIDLNLKEKDMKKMLIFAMTLFAVFNANSSESADQRVYKAWQGNIQISELENVISENLKANVKFSSMRWTYNPAAYAAYLVFGGYAAYVINFKINGLHDVVCDFTMILDENRSMITDCSSKTAAVDFIGFIKNSEIGLPPFEGYKERFN